MKTNHVYDEWLLNYEGPKSLWSSWHRQVLCVVLLGCLGFFGTLSFLLIMH